MGNQKMAGVRNRLKGILYGVACGDALGAPLEFMTAADIKRQFGYVTDMQSGGWMNVQPGETTDDTAMTLCVAEGIVANPDHPCYEIGNNFIKWYASRPKDVGRTCDSAIYNYLLGAMSWPDAAKLTHEQLDGKSAGNGSLMRTAFIGMYYTDIGFMSRIARDVSKMTHYDDQASDACELCCRMLHDMIVSNDLYVRHDVLRQRIRTNPVYSIALNPTFRPYANAYVVNTFAAALSCLMRTNSLENAVCMAVNLGYDTDTVGAVTGSIAGALYGFDKIPARWVKALDSGLVCRLDTLTDYAAEQWEEMIV